LACELGGGLRLDGAVQDARLQFRRAVLRDGGGVGNGPL
jgi:hypothetical protein